MAAPVAIGLSPRRCGALEFRSLASPCFYRDIPCLRMGLNLPCRAGEIITRLAAGIGEITSSLARACGEKGEAMFIQTIPHSQALPHRKNALGQMHYNSSTFF